MKRHSRRSTPNQVIAPHDGSAGCGGKRCYPSFSVASKLARNMRRYGDDVVEAYHCTHCGRFHIGSSKRRSIAEHKHNKLYLREE